MNPDKSNLKKRLLKNNVFYQSIKLFSYALLIPLAFILFYIIKNGISYLNLDFLIKMPAPVGETGGGALNAIIGSFLIVGLSGLIAVPLGILIGIFLAEFKEHKINDLTRLSIETLQGIPSIIYGIVAYVWFVMPFGKFSGISASIALALMMLPMVAKATEESMKMIPYTLKEASYALGANYYSTIKKVILPSCRKGIISGILIGISRILGETAPLLFTAFGNAFLNFNMAKPINALPLLIYNYASSPYQEWHQIAWSSSLFLIIIVLGLSIIAKNVIK
ncbi:phosphate ABC transporter, permease protein PstA [bacterium]|nr:phosphate ABC transporter, permease protein PstA [bacterium]